MARRLGITSFQSADRYGLALTLGAGEVRLTELTAAYGALASGGYRVDPVLVTRITSADGEILYEAPAPRRERVLDERVAWLVTDVLADPQARVTTFGAGSSLETPFGAAVKTGTTTDWRDNWTVGYTRSMVVGVWVGNADNAPMEHISGVEGAAPIWQATMVSLHPTAPAPFVRPADLEQRTVCAASGLLPGPACTHLRDEWFLPGSVPEAVCTMHRLETLDAATGRLADASTPPERRITRKVTRWPADALLWAEQNGLATSPEAAAGVPGKAGADESGAVPPGALRLARPVQGARYCLATDLAGAYQMVEVVAVGPEGAGLSSLTVEVDGVPWQIWAAPPYRAFWPLAAGEHKFALVGTAADGTALESEGVRITVATSCD